MTSHLPRDIELRALNMAAHGLTFKRIAEELYVSERTAKNYLINVRKYLCAKNISHAVFLGMSLGLIDAEKSEHHTVIRIFSIPDKQDCFLLMKEAPGSQVEE